MQDCVGVTCINDTNHSDCFASIGTDENIAYVPLKDNLEGGTFFIILDGESEDGATAEVSIEQTPLVL